MERLNYLQDAMKSNSVDLVVLAPGGYLNWLAALSPHSDERPFLVLVSQTKVGVLVPQLEAQGLKAKTSYPLYAWHDATGPDAALVQLLKDLGGSDAKVLALDEAMRADHAGLVRKFLPNANQLFMGESLGALRMRKSESEYQLLKQNALVADAAMRKAWAQMHVGMGENDVAQIIADSFAHSGARSLFRIVASGANGAMPHYMAGESVLRPGDPVVMDIGGRMHGYCSDMTRMASIGAPSPELVEVHGIVEEAVQAAMAAARPGVAARDVDAAARQVIARAGYGAYFNHRVGHGLGQEVHEAPYLTGTADTVLEEGMVFSIEPGIYLPDRFGVRLEEIVILRADGPEILSELPRDIHVVEN